MIESSAERFIKRVTGWARRDRNIAAAILVGSYARGEQRPDSDVDIVLLCRSPIPFLESLHWIRGLGPTDRVSRKEFKTLTTFEIAFRDGVRAELGIAPRSWDLLTRDPEVQGILATGARSLYDSRHLRIAL